MKYVTYEIGSTLSELSNLIYGVLQGSVLGPLKFSLYTTPLYNTILGSLLHPVDSVRNLGVWFDADFSFSEHIKRTCKACFLQMRDLRRIRKYLTPEVALFAANALVSSRLDYCNSLFRGLSGFSQYKFAKYSEHPCSYCYKS